jgi:hypothetical protein
MKEDLGKTYRYTSEIHRPRRASQASPNPLTVEFLDANPDELAGRSVASFSENPKFLAVVDNILPVYLILASSAKIYNGRLVD